jgi:DNA-binding NtrC family response regulator
MKLSEELILPKHIPPLTELNKVEVIEEKPTISSKPDNLIDYNLDKNNLEKIKDDTERIALLNALKSTNGNSAMAASKLGISLRSFYYKIKKYNIKKIYEYK